MAVVDQNLEYNIRKALEIIQNLPEEDKRYVGIYIDNLKTVLENYKLANRQMRDIFKQIAYYGKSI